MPIFEYECMDCCKISQIIQAGSYMTDGCASSRISGSFAVELAIGKTLDELADITGEDVFREIGRLPEEDSHCPFLAAQTIQDALTDYMNRGNKTKHQT